MTVATAAAQFRALHHSSRPLVLPNVWDAVSAQVCADAGFSALATTSSAIAATLGYADGQATPAAEMFAAITRIVRSVDIPVTADVEAGYGLAARELVDRLTEAGAVGCNLEDSDPASRRLTGVSRQADYLAAVREAATGALVINARIDVFLTSHPGLWAATDTVVSRAQCYLAAGADCTFPIMAPPATLPFLVRRIAGPVNAIATPTGGSLEQLAAIGVARISFGGGLHFVASAALRQTAAALQSSLQPAPAPLTQGVGR